MGQVQHGANVMHNASPIGTNAGRELESLVSELLNELHHQLGHQVGEVLLVVDVDLWVVLEELLGDGDLVRVYVLGLVLSGFLFLFLFDLISSLLSQQDIHRVKHASHIVFASENHGLLLG